MANAYPPGTKYCRGWIAEVTFGTIVAGALSWVGELLSWSDDTKMNAKFDHYPGSRTYGDVSYAPEYGFTAKFRSRASVFWTAFFAVNGMGSASGIGTTLPSFDIIFDIYDGTTHQYYVYSGCKINVLTISGTKGGEYLEFQIQCFSQFRTISTSKTLTDIQSVTIGADASTPGGDVLKWAVKSQINVNAGGLVDWNPHDWKATVNNHLKREPGFKTGADSIVYPVPIAISEGIQDIEFTGKLHLDTHTYLNAKRLKYAVTAQTLTIDTKVITLANGNFPGDDFYEGNNENPDEENVSIKFKGCTIA